ncbi:DUF3005 domain-containing protein [Caballeronia sp. LZ062]|uniref:DUF3005 domain-containing protein n=1 Tax=unclassified Caballeronia TaxID=2646786 RepID=UPI00285445A9|nr:MULTISPECIES: DUF3005 domain-containing protein [unclassified Caballeronia]MDR5857629.1 DUF3005 domain-containing protein [Caballeronia sp. LZ050]MDR5869179.1 DUF3005 domain-containing protein [Caballeronia sp. LZ062]
MNNAESNELQGKQSERAAESPVKTPAAETAHIRMSDAMAAESGRDAPRDAARGASSATTEGLQRHPRGVDVLNDDTLDDTVDTDAKNIHAKRGGEMLAREPDAVIVSNATLSNHVPEPSSVLAGFDSRPGYKGFALALARGCRVVDRGMAEPALPEIEEHLRFEARDAHGHTLRGRNHYALNHMRPSRLIVIERS